MKKSIFIIAILGLPLCLAAKTVVLDEGFESGTIPATWTQEYGSRNQKTPNNAPTCPWSVEKGDTSSYPTGAAQGVYRAYFRNTTGQTQNYITRLVLPPIDLYDINEPILRFSYAQTKWRTDIDTLRVLYRRDSVDNWHVLYTAAQSQPVWKRIELRLPSISQTYQIAFEASDNLGRGIVLDSIQVRDLPQCTTPYNLVVTEIAGGEATIHWNADYDATGFRIVVDETREFTSDAEPWQLHLTDLTVGTHTVRVQALCDGENSPLSAVKTFEMPIEQPLPYSYNFNDCPKSTVAWWPKGWHFGNNAGMDAFVTNNNSENRLDRVSADKSPALLFCMDNFYIRSIPANNYQYATTPALTGAPLNTCRVSFSAGVYEYNGANYAHSIIVGVMTDAQNITTFVPVDTVSVTLYEGFQNCYVNLDNYEGNGRFVAFMSNFDKTNIFYIDNVSVKPHEESEAPVNVHAIGHTNEIVVKWEGSSSLYGIELHSDEIKVVLKDIQGSDSVVPFDTILHNVAGSTITVKDMREWTRYTARVWAEDGDTSEWVNCRTSLPYKWPLSYNFDTDVMETVHFRVNDYTAPKGVQTFTTGKFLPNCVASTSYEKCGLSGKGFGVSESLLNGESSADYWASYPYMEGMDTMQLQFYYNSGTEYYAGKSWLSVYVAEDPQDMSTWQELELCVGTTIWQRYVIDLKNAPLKNGFVIMRWYSKDPAYSCKGWVDNVQFGARGECDMVKDIKVDATAPQCDQALIRYVAPIGTTIRVRVSTDRYLNENQLEAGSSCKFKKDNALGGSTSITATGLDYMTTYYVFMQTVCSDGSKSLWSNPVEFTTPCLQLDVPYTENFEDWSSAAPKCWYSKKMAVNMQTVSHNSMHSIKLTSDTCGDTAYVMMPALKVPVKDVRMRFYGNIYMSGNGELSIGVCDDPDDMSTFHLLATAVSKSKEYEVFEYAFSNYTGTGSHLCLMIGCNTTFKSSQIWHIDDLEILSLECIKPFNITMIDRQANSIQTKWDGTSKDGWQVLVADQEIDPENPSEAGSHVKVNAVAKEPSYKATGLEAQTTYYFYYRPLCDGAEWADTTFMTACRPLELGKTYDFEDQTATTKDYSIPEEAHIECWTMMNSGSNDRSSVNVPYVYQNATYASSGKNCLYMKPQNGIDQYSWIALPFIDVPDMTLVTVAFNAMHNYTYNWMYIEVGVMTDPEDMSTFVLCQRITPTQTQTRYKVNLENYTGDGKYVALRAAGSTYPVYVDDITVTQAPCKNLHPTIEEVTFQAVRVKTNFDYNTKWQVRIFSEDGFYTDSTIWLSKEATIMGLPAHTQLTMLSASICSITDTDTVFGDWDEQTFMTECADVLVEETELEDFEGMKARTNYKDPYYDIPCWHTGNQKSSTSYPYVITQETKDLPRSGYGENQKLNGAYSGKNSLVFVTGSGSDGAWAAMPKLAQAEDMTKVQVTFWAKGSQYFGSNKLAVGITTDLNDWATFIPIDTIEARYEEYTKFVVRFDTYRGDWDGKYGRYVTFASQFEADNMIFIDDVKLSHIPDCAEPTNVRTIEIGDSHTSITWNGNATNYRVMVCDSAVAEEDWESNTTYLSNDTIESDNYIVNTPSLKHYYVYVKAICESGDGSWNIKGVDFAPLCGAKWQVPDVQSFEGSNLLPDCWRKVGHQGYDSLVVVNDVAHTGTYSVKLLHKHSNTAAGMMLPLMSLEPGDCKISFWVKKSKGVSKSINVALVADPDISMDSLYKVKSLHEYTIIENQEWQNVVVDFNAMTDEEVEGKPYIVLYSKTSGLDKQYIWIDDVEIIQMPSCRAPRKMVAQMTTGSTAEVTITPFRSYNTEWEIAVTDTITKTTTTTKTTTKTTTISGLSTDRVYALTARTVCGEGEQSEWGDTIFVHTIVLPTGLVAQPTDTTVVLTWDKHEPTQWNVFVSTTFILPSEVESKMSEFIQIEHNLTDSIFVFNANEDTKYYFLLQSANMGSGKDTYIYTSTTTLKHVYTPTNLQITAVSDSSVSISWHDTYIKSSHIQISTDAEFTTLIADTFVNGIQTFSYNQLEENTTYYVRVAQVNGTWPQSEWASTSFTTRCGLVGIPFEYGFEETTLPRCWTTISNRSGYPKANTSSGYHSEGNQSWDFYASSADHCPQAIVLPGLDANLSECIVRFKARCHNASGSNYGDAMLYVALTSDPTKLTVGDIASQYIVDSLNISGKTFIQYEADFTTLNPLDLQGKPYIIIYLNAKGRVYMDELIVKESDKCRKPMLLRAIETTGHTATLTFDQAKPSGNWTYAVCSDTAMTDTIAQGSITSQTFLVKGLQKSTTYYASVRQICDAENISDASEVTTFTTMLAPYYEELFHTDTIPTDWSKASGWADSIFAGQAFEQGLNNWKIQDNNIAIAGKHMGYWFNSNWHQSWLLSPRISLDENDSTILSFDAAITCHDNQMPFEYEDKIELLCAISTDGGKTWKRENATAITGLSTNAERHAISLMPYLGHVIQIGFYAGLRKNDEIVSADYHLGNVHINYYETRTTEVTVCEFEDIIFEPEGIFIEGGTYPPGDHSDSILIPAANPQGGLNKDVMEKYTAHILPSPEEVIEDVMCDGDSYSGYGFTNLVDAGTYRRKLIATNGCDSLLTLHLSKKLSQHTYIKDTIEQGQSYQMLGKEYTQTGIYTDTTVASNFCDSIVTLALYVKGSKTSEFSAVTCEGTPYVWNNTDYWFEGDYYQLFKAQSGGDSIVTLHLKVDPLKWDTIYDTFAPGTTYNKYNFMENKPGEYRHTYPSQVTGCDSTTVLYLMIQSGLEDLYETQQVQKILDKQQIIIIRNKKRFNVLGELQ